MSMKPYSGKFFAGAAAVVACLFSGGAMAASYVTAKQTITVPHGSSPTTHTVTCPAGYVVTGGGFEEYNQVASDGGGMTPVIAANNQIAYVGNPYFVVFQSRPTDAGDGWTIYGMVNTVGDATVTVYARCATPN